MKPAFLAASGGAILGAALAVSPTTQTWAQESESAALEEVTVTGSRIPRRDFTANSPITTLGQEAFETTATVGVETILNQLPQFVPAVTQFVTTDVQQTATNTVGASTVSLRGLGPNRNLVLINGRRAVPVDGTMAVDTNIIPGAAIARVEVISGGASAVYGADAVGGVVNFILKDDFEGATVDVRFGDTFDGGNQETTISGLIGANVAGDRGNVMLGVERSTRSLQERWERDWRVEDMRNPSTPATAFFWGTDTWLSNGQFLNFFDNFLNLPAQATVDQIFDQAPAGSISNNVNFTRFLINRDSGTIYTGLMQSGGAAGSYRYEGPFDDDPDGNFPGLPFRVVQPDGTIKENNFWQWSSIPLERLSAFANGHFDVSDSVRVTAQALVSRNENQTSLGLTADNITIWGAAVPFGNDAYLGDPANGIPNPLNPDGTTHPDYLLGGRFGVDCEGTSQPWNDGLAGCTQSEAWPVTPEVWQLFRSRLDPDADIWASRPPDYLRDALGAARSSTNVTTTMQLQLGVEGDLPSGNDFWDVTFSTGQTDNLSVQRGSTRLSTYRRLMASPNFGRNAIFDPNAYTVGFAESIATCTSGLPIIDDRDVTHDCAIMLSPDLKNKRVVDQTIMEANLVGDLAEMPAGALQYALGLSYRENSFSFEPDNLSQNQNFIDPIAGLFPNEDSFGEYDVSEIYGELLIPIVSDSPVGDFNIELGGRVSDWSLPEVNSVNTYKALIDWTMAPRYRLRGGVNRALRAPNLGELFTGRTQIFPPPPTPDGDPCSFLNTVNPQYGVNSSNPQQATQALSLCTQLMGGGGAENFYITDAINQPNPGGAGIQNSFGNPNLHEEQADTFTLGMVMDFHDNWTLTVDYYNIEITDMIAAESAGSIYQRCLSLESNPTGNINHEACQLILRNPTTGAAANIDRTFTNQGESKMEGLDLQLNWNRLLTNGGFNMNMVANYVLASETRERPESDVIDWAGTDGCSLQIQCQGYDYRLFTTLNYFRGNWNFSLRHQFWPAIDDGSCLMAPEANACVNGGVDESYQLVALSASYLFADRYTLRFGIENLFDEEPPCRGANPDNLAFPIPCQRAAGLTQVGLATYDQIGRRGFLSLTMDF